MFSLTQIRPRVFHLKFNDSREMSMTFFRYTEFYESKYDSIRGHKFTMAQHMGLYCREYLKNNNLDWTYCTDWGGYNIPVDIIKQVHDMGILDPNHYDSFMYSIYHMIMSQTQNKSAYLIGTYGEKKDSLLKHEMAHAMFYVDTNYKKEVTDLIQRTDQNLIKSLYKILSDQNYPAKVLDDELQAYLTTGDYGWFKKFSRKKDFKSFESKMRKIYRSHIKNF
jgi:hypothetical protein